MSWLTFTPTARYEMSLLGRRLLFSRDDTSVRLAELQRLTGGTFRTLRLPLAISTLV
jgi:hypothetical protein